ncbi:MAG: hypothetical protein IPG92_11260 [Flavobacteriales bacterium]|nr:hypothetical protein [Flavobacteriales bacterium]
MPQYGQLDPLAIRVGGPVGAGLQHMGEYGRSDYNTDDPLNLTNNPYTDPVTADLQEWQVDFGWTVQRQTDLYGDAINDAAQPRM